MIVKQRLEYFDVTTYVASAVDKISRIHMNNIDTKIPRAVESPPRSVNFVIHVSRKVRKL